VLSASRHSVSHRHRSPSPASSTSRVRYPSIST
jgi:hypothetical protein